MVKLLLMSLLIANIALPARFASSKNARVGLRRTVAWMVMFNGFYLFFLVVLYHRMSG
ncbi:MAG: hypothetical protein IT381_26670 [Deltaproteobacteria bacterium]|nr:hypothetical protein [Deltaproteobacteria bacterium]